MFNNKIHSLYKFITKNPIMGFLATKTSSFFIRVLHRITIERKSYFSVIILRNFEVLFNDTFYVLFATITTIILTSTIFCLGLMYPNSVGKSICSFIKTNSSLKLQKTLWKDLLFSYQPLEYKTFSSKKRPYAKTNVRFFCRGRKGGR